MATLQKDKTSSSLSQTCKQRNDVLSALLLLLITLLLAAAMRPRGGFFNPSAMLFLVCVFALFTLFFMKITKVVGASTFVLTKEARQELLCYAMKGVLFWQLWMFLEEHPQYFQAAVLVALVVAIDFTPAIFDKPLFQRRLWSLAAKLWQQSRPFLVLLIFSGVCLYQLLFAKVPHGNLPDRVADVYIFQDHSCRALLKGINPYTITFPNIYSHEMFYGAGLVKDGVLQFGYVYLPLTLLLAIPGYLLGDVRLALFVSMLLSGAILMTFRPARLAFLAGTMLLFTPYLLPGLRIAWTEPFVIVTFCGVLWCAQYRPQWLVYALGAWLASKQYVVLLFPLTWLLLPSNFSWQEKARLLTKASLVAILITLPMALWNLEGFFHSAILLQFKQPFRDDSLSFLVLYKLLTSVQPSFWVPFIVMTLALAFTLRCAPRSLSGFCSSVAFVLFLFVAFNKQAFMNYYFVVFAALFGTFATWAFDWNSNEQVERKILA